MSKRGIVIVSVMFGLFVMSFGALGVRALTLGPDAPTPSATELAARQQTANALEQNIRTARADVPPALTAVPQQVIAARAAAPAAAAPQAYGGEEYEEEYEEEQEEYEGGEYEDEDHEEYEEGDRDDD
jgi:hypothetical protein